MSEYIEREIALAALSKSGVTCNMRASKIVARQPAADVAPVVRCRECKYHKPIDYCEKHKKTGWFDDDFCCRGQRKEAPNAGT